MIKHIRSCTSSVLSQEQKTHLIELAATLMANTAVTEVGGHGSQKSQTHLHTHNYYCEDEWVTWGNKDYTMQKKFNIMSKVWINWGLRFPSAPTFRGGLAVIAAAMSMDLNPQHAHALFHEFQTEFRKLRGVYHGEASLKTFPSDPKEFMKMYPSLLSNVVACRVDIGSVLEFSNKKSIPCRGNNAAIAPRTSASSRLSTVETPREQMLRGLLETAMSSGSIAPASSPTRDSSVRRTQAAAMPPVLAEASAENQPIHALEDIAVVPTAAAAMIPNAANAAPGHGQASETADPTFGLEPSEPNRSRIDKLASLAADFIRQKKNAADKKKAVKTKDNTKKPDGGDEEDDADDEEHEEDDEDDETEGASASNRLRRPAAAKASSTKKRPAAAKKRPAAAKIRPAAAASSSTRVPKIDMEGTVYHAGGKLYNYPKRKLFRVWPRAYDKHDKAVRYGDNPSAQGLQECWKRAVNLITTDPRPVAV